MQSHKSPGSATSELRGLIEVLSSPDKLEKAMGQYEARVKAAQEAERSLGEKMQALAKKEAELKSQEESISALALKAAADKKEASEKLAAAVSREGEFARLDRELTEREIKFRASHNEAHEAVEQKRRDVELRESKLAELEKKAQEVLKENEQKLAKIKAFAAGL